MEDASRDNSTDFGIQWHITDRCNLRCVHCYQEDYSGNGELSLDGLLHTADEIVETLAKWNKRGDVALTGGEPLMSDHLLPVMRHLDAADSISGIDILSNGTLIAPRFAQNVRQLNKLRAVQLSLDGATPESNDAIRGAGTFERTMKGLRLLRSYGITVNLMFTLQRRNTEDVPGIVRLAKSEGINTVSIERFVPIGSGRRLRNESLSPVQVKQVFEEVSALVDSEDGCHPTKICRSRPLWVLCDRQPSGAGVNSSSATPVGGICSIGLDGLCILPDATVLPCRRLPIAIGNLRRDSLSKIWHTSDLLWEIADKRNLKGRCRKCEFLLRCSGCRAMAYAYTGDYLAEDPQCWKEQDT